MVDNPYPWTRLLVAEQSISYLMKWVDYLKSLGLKEMLEDAEYRRHKAISDLSSTDLSTIHLNLISALSYPYSLLSVWLTVHISWQLS